MALYSKWVLSKCIKFQLPMFPCPGTAIFQSSWAVMELKTNHKLLPVAKKQDLYLIQQHFTNSVPNSDTQKMIA